jgi:hypothetical protein
MVLHADIPRAVPNGAAARATRIGGGAALFSLRLAVAGRGRRPVVTLLPDPNRPRVLAVIRPGPRAGVRPDERRLLFALAGDAPPSDGPAWPIPPTARHLLRRAAEAEGIWSHQLLRPDERDAVIEALPPGTGADAERAVMLILIATTHDSPTAQLQAGQALQRMLLTATALGVDAAVLAGPAELAPITTATPALSVGRGTVPQVLLTVGSGAALAASA